MNVLIIGATSGIGKALCDKYATLHHKIAIVGRRDQLLKELSANYPESVTAYKADISDVFGFRQVLDEIFDDMKAIDLVYLCAGIGELNPSLNYELEKAVIQTNVVGWTAAVDTVFNYFYLQKYGYLAIISSVGGLRGEPAAPSYSASKAYQMNYAEALRKRAIKEKLPIYITDIRPGLVDTRMAKGGGLFWVMSTTKVASQIVRAINKRQKITVVTRRWKVIHYIMKRLPNWLYDRL